MWSSSIQGSVYLRSSRWRRSLFVMRDDPDLIARAGVVSLWARVAGVARHPNPRVSDHGVPALSFAVLGYVALLPPSAVFPPVVGDPSQYDPAWSSSSASARRERAS